MAEHDGKEVLRRALAELKRLKAENAELRRDRSEPIAIVGIGCRFAGGANDPASLWRVLEEGRDTIREVPADRWSIDDFYDPRPGVDGKMYTRWGGFIDGVDQFDAAFFGITPREATSLDPQQRILLEVTHEALDHAGIPSTAIHGSRTGVWAGVSSNDYLQLLLRDGSESDAGYTLTGVVPNLAAGRVAYVLGAHGPTLTVDTACSSSLVATHLAVQSLRRGECDVALAGGVNVIVAPEPTIAFCNLRAMSPEGRCKTFDANADGYVRSEGCGVVVLERLSDAVAKGHRIVAVIRGSALNHDGKSSGLTVPNGAAQRAVIEAALADGGVNASDVGYLEAHGTGTPLGDPIEVRAANAVYGESDFRIASLKTNFGHTEAAAGVLGLIKAALIHQHGAVPPHLHFSKLNPKIDLGGARIVPEGAAHDGRMTAVSSFGFSGTNAHVVLEAAPPAPVTTPSHRHAYALPLSARSEAALAETCARFADRIDREPEDVYDLAATSALRRAAHPHRVVAVGRNADEITTALRRRISKGPHRETPEGRAGPRSAIAFVYSGQGTQWTGMGAVLLEREPVFAEAFRRAADALAAHGVEELERKITTGDLAATELAQPAIFAVQYALTALLAEWGVRPDAVVGHSVGELAAAVASGRMSLESIARVTALRARRMQKATGLGRMAAVELGEAAVRDAIAGEAVAIAALNGPASVVIAGPSDALDRVVAKLRAQRAAVTWLDVDYAFHSPQMAPLAAQLEAELGALDVAAGDVPFYSTVSGARENDALDATYWRRNVEGTVRFAPAIDAMVADGIRTFVEVGSHPALLRYLARDGVTAMRTLRRGEDEAASMMRAAGELFVHGAEVDWAQIYPESAPVDLPAYPWQHQRYWRPAPVGAPAAKHPLLGTRREEDGRTVFEGRIDPAATPYLDDHRMYDVVVFPAAGYVELARAAAAAAFGGPQSIHDFEVRAPLILDRPQQVRVAVAKDGAIEIASDIVHVRARAAKAGPSKTATQSSAGPDAVDAAEVYAAGAAVGVGLGPRFTVLDRIWRDGRDTVASVRSVEDDGHGVHPVVIDACLQAAMASSGDVDRGLMLPVSIGAVEMNREAGRAVQARFSPRRKDTDGFTGDAVLIDGDGVVVVAMHEIHFRRAPKDALLAARARAVASLLYARAWVEAPSSDAERGDQRFHVRGDDALAARLNGGALEDATDVVLVAREVSPDDFLTVLRAGPARLWILGSDRDPAAATAIGLARTARLEHAEVEVRIVDGGDVVDELRRPGAEQEIRLDGGRRVARLAPLAIASGTVDLSGVHLITGGRGALGVATARWLLSRGAKRVVLASRHIDEPPIAGVEVRALDVTDGNAVRKLLEELRPDTIFHAAGVLDDAPLEALTPERIEAVVAPKSAVEHFAASGADLVLYSSVASLVGSPGQAAYVAANTYLDAFAASHEGPHRVLSVAWGPWAGDGMAADVAEAARRRGLEPLQAPEAFAALEMLLASDVRHAAVAHLDAAAFVRAFGARRPSPLSDLAPVTDAALARRLAEADDPEAVAAAYVEDQIRDVLGLDAVDLEEDLTAAGMDSLMALELRDALERDLGHALAPSVLFDHRTGRALAEFVVAQASKTPVKRRSIVPDPANAYAPFPLNDVQEAYWIGRGGALELGGISCHYFGAFAQRGLDPDRLAEAWVKLVRHHPMLRAVVDEDGRQRVLEAPPDYAVPIVDLRDTSSDEIEATLTATREEMSHQMFDTSRWPLFDVRIFRLADETRLFISFDLLILDVFSFVTLLAQWRHVYEGGALEPVGLTFRDYVQYEHAERESDTYRDALKWWRERTKTLPPAPDLPLAKSPRAIERPHFVRRTAKLSAEHWRQLVARAKAAQVTPSMAVCAAYAEVIARYSRGDRFTLNLTLFNRAPVHPDVQRVIGDFTSLILLDVDHEAPAGFADRAQSLQATLRQNVKHSAVSGVRVLREWGRTQGRRASAPIVFTSALGLTGDLQNEADATVRWLGDVVDSVSQTPQVWLDHQVFEQSGGLFLAWDCVEDLFPAGMLDEMFETYVGLLEHLATHDWDAPRRPLLPAASLARIEAANATKHEVPTGLLHEPLARRAAETPNAIALVTSRRQLTYAQLFTFANRTAHALVHAGVKPGDVVAVMTDKNQEQIVATFGVLTAGGAYLPIDPALPEARIHDLLAQTGASVVLTEPYLRASIHLPEDVVALDVEDPPFPNASEAPLPTTRTPTDLAYVIFTSGSTGRPKGVMIDHRGALNTCLDVNERFGVKAGDRVFALSSLSFDLSVYDVFGTIAAGATMVIPDDCGMRDPDHWHELMARENVSVWNSVPALLGMYLEYVGGESLPVPDSLRLAMLSGDWIPLEVPPELWSRRPGVDVVSLGGATEGSIWSIAYPIERMDPAWKSVPYGRAMKNQTFYVLDRDFEHCPTWVVGDLYIGGVGVAMGYFGDPERTAKQFGTHPRTGERLYATGDLGRWRPDGHIEFLGREDNQVKIQGHRIELGEIESVLREHDAVREAVVQPQKATTGETQLVGYLLCDDDAPPDTDLRAHLGRRLPAHMVPKVYVTLDAFPLSANGKVDRKALPAPDAAPRAVVEPRTELEAAILDAWRDVLGLTTIGVDDDFFDVGGYSQLAVRLTLELRARLGVEIPIRALFDTPTVAALAARLEGDVAAPTVAAGDEDVYTRYARRGIGLRLAAIRTDKHYVRASGNTLEYERDGRRVAVLDMVGGFGSTIFGHNHPELTALMCRISSEGTPAHAQYTNNVWAGRLCEALSERLQAATQRSFVVTLVSTGTEAVEAAIKHAKLEYQTRVARLLRTLEREAALAMSATLSPEVTEEARSLLGEVHDVPSLVTAARRHAEAILERPPVFLALEHAFHGLTSGALSLTAAEDFRAPFAPFGVQTHRIGQAPSQLEAQVEAQTSDLFAVGVDADGRVTLRRRAFTTIAALFVEPIQGEGGIRPLEAAFVTAAQTQSSRCGFPLIVDEIQCGMGRTGRFTGAERVGLAGHYYTFSKSLGGGLTKVAAMAVEERRYHEDFGYLHGSTFAEDAPGSRVALAALQLLDRDDLLAACETKGALFAEKLRALKTRHPSVIEDVRGAGLMLGVQIAAQDDSPSYVLRAVSRSDPEMFNQLIAGFLLNEHHIRIAPTKTRNTIRFLPSAYVTEEEMDRVVAAFEQVCEVVENVNVGRLLRHLVVDDVDPADVITDWRGRYPELADEEPQPGDRRVAHIAHLEDVETTLLAEPSLSEVPLARLEPLLGRLFRFTRPAVGQRMRITTKTGEIVHLSLLGLVLTSRMFESMMQTSERGTVLDKIEEALDVAIDGGASVVGFGGYTSIATLNCTAVATTRAALTSGNAYTVVLAVEGARRAAAEAGVDLANATVAVVGAKGNIGSIAARLIGPAAARIVLIGRDASDARLRCIAEDLDNAVVSDRMKDLAACDVVITCTSASVPVIRPEHLSDRVRVICDVATPKDVDESVRAAFPKLRLLSGGLARLPGDAGRQLVGTRLPVDHVYGCVAETTLLGAAGYTDNFSFGDLDLDRVETIRRLATEHGYDVGVVEQDRE